MGIFFHKLVFKTSCWWWHQAHRTRDSGFELEAADLLVDLHEHHCTQTECSCPWAVCRSFALCLVLGNAPEEHSRMLSVTDLQAALYGRMHG